MESGVLLLSGLLVCFLCTAALVLQISTNPALAITAILSATSAFVLDDFEAVLPPGYAYIIGAIMIAGFSLMTFGLWFFFTEDDDFPEVSS